MSGRRKSKDIIEWDEEDSSTPLSPEHAAVYRRIISQERDEARRSEARSFRSSRRSE